MKIIKSITTEGIVYINETGEDCFVNFKKCNESWINYRIKTENLNIEEINNLKKHDKCVGQRNICSDIKFIEFFTYPKFTRFTFQESKEYKNAEIFFSSLKNNITLAGWTTIDLS